MHQVTLLLHEHWKEYQLLAGVSKMPSSWESFTFSNMKLKHNDNNNAG